MLWVPMHKMEDLQLFGDHFAHLLTEGGIKWIPLAHFVKASAWSTVGRGTIPYRVKESR